jgi:hypothetical protein
MGPTSSPLNTPHIEDEAPSSLRWPTRGWCWLLGPKRGSGNPSLLLNIPRDTCRWWEWASGGLPALALRGTPSRASLILRTSSRHTSSDAERDGLIHERRGRESLRSPHAEPCVWPRYSNGFGRFEHSGSRTPTTVCCVSVPRIQAYIAYPFGCEVSDVRSRLAKSSKRAERDACPLHIHREFIGLCESVLEWAHPCALCKGKPAARRGREAYGP